MASSCNIGYVEKEGMKSSISSLHARTWQLDQRLSQMEREAKAKRTVMGGASISPRLRPGEYR